MKGSVLQELGTEDVSRLHGRPITFLFEGGVRICASNPKAATAGFPSHCEAPRIGVHIEHRWKARLRFNSLGKHSTTCVTKLELHTYMMHV